MLPAVPAVISVHSIGIRAELRKFRREFCICNWNLIPPRQRKENLSLLTFLPGVNNAGSFLFDILIHYGLETVDLKGEGFEVLVNVGDDVKIGDLIMKVDLDLLLMKQIETMSPVVFLQKENITILKQKDNVFTIEVS